MFSYGAPREKRPISRMRATKAQISLRKCAGWSGPSLPVYRSIGHCKIYGRIENALDRLCGAHADLGLCCLNMTWGRFSHIVALSYSAEGQTSCRSLNNTPSVLSCGVSFLRLLRLLYGINKSDFLHQPNCLCMRRTNLCLACKCVWCVAQENCPYATCEHERPR